MAYVWVFGERCVFADLGERFEGVYDEDDRDQSGEALLGEARDQGDERRQVERDDAEQNQRRPQTDPETTGQEVPALLAKPTLRSKQANQRPTVR